MKNCWIVFQQTYLESIRTKLYWWTTIFLIMVGFLSLFLLSVVGKLTSEDNTTVSSPKERQQLQIFQNNHFQIGRSLNSESYKEVYMEKVLDGAGILQYKGEPSIIEMNTYRKENAPLLVQSTKNGSQAFYPQQILAKEIAYRPSVQIETGINRIGDYGTNKLLIINLWIVMMYVAVTTYGNSIATAITIEKSSRVAEVIITKISPVSLIFGKITGVVLSSLTQFLLFFTSMILIISLELLPIPKGSLVETIANSFTVPYAIYLLLLLILGYFIYASLFAIIGSFAKGSEELTISTIPISMVFVLGLMVVIFVVNLVPEIFMYAVTSYIPFTAPISLMMRIINEVISPIEIILSICSMLISITLFLLLAAKIYPKGIFKTIHD